MVPKKGFSKDCDGLIFKPFFFNLCWSKCKKDQTKEKRPMPPLATA